MTTTSRLVPISLIMSVGGLLALMIAHLALLDIHHGEADVHQEWAALQVAFLIVLSSQVLALVTLWRTLRDRTGPAQGTVAV